jgi:hypothetical protein
VDERAPQLARADVAADRPRAVDPQPVEPPDDADAEQQPERADDLRRRVQADDPVERAGEVDGDAVVERALAEAVERDGAATGARRG